MVDFIYPRRGLLLENSLYKTFNFWIFLASSPCLPIAKILIHCLRCVFCSILIKDSYHIGPEIIWTNPLNLLRRKLSLEGNITSHDI